MTTISTIRHLQKKDVLGTYKMMKTDFEVIQMFKATKWNSNVSSEAMLVGLWG